MARGNRVVSIVADRVILDPAGTLTHPDCERELRRRLAELADERMSAREHGLAGDPCYVEDLNDEIAATRSIHAGAVIVQLALLRGELGDRGTG
jgi:hypothetical protein